MIACARLKQAYLKPNEFEFIKSNQASLKFWKENHIGINCVSRQGREGRRINQEFSSRAWGLGAINVLEVVLSNIQ